MGHTAAKPWQAGQVLTRFFFACSRLRLHAFSRFFNSSLDTERIFRITASNFWDSDGVVIGALPHSSVVNLLMHRLATS